MMLDQLTRDIKTRLEEVLREADKLRRALSALTSAAQAPDSAADSAAPKSPPPKTPAARPAQRTAPGATKHAVLNALANGTAMTATEVAAATGLSRSTVAPTLSKLVKTGEVTKAARGYQTAVQVPAQTPTAA